VTLNLALNLGEIYIKVRKAANTTKVLEVANLYNEIMNHVRN
jgi:hypothetical protein